MKSFLRSLLYSLVLPWLGVAAFYSIICLFLALTGLYMFVAGWFYGMVFIWVAAWAIFLLMCYAKSAELRRVGGNGAAG